MKSIGQAFGYSNCNNWNQFFSGCRYILRHYWISSLIFTTNSWNTVTQLYNSNNAFFLFHMRKLEQTEIKQCIQNLIDNKWWISLSAPNCNAILIHLVTWGLPPRMSYCASFIINCTLLWFHLIKSSLNRNTLGWALPQALPNLQKPLRDWETASKHRWHGTLGTPSQSLTTSSSINLRMLRNLTKKLMEWQYAHNVMD